MDHIENVKNGKAAKAWYNQLRDLFPMHKNLSDKELGKFFIDRFMKQEKKNFILNFDVKRDKKLQSVFTVSKQELLETRIPSTFIKGHVEDGKFIVDKSGVIRKNTWYVLIDELFETALENAGKRK